MKRNRIQALYDKKVVCAFNFYNLESWQAIVRAGLVARADVILAASESAMAYMGDEFLKMVASQGFLHLDHGKSIDSCKRAIALGFKSVMIDGSHLSFAENVKLTRRVVEYAHKRGVLVEAELGAIGGAEDNVSAKIEFTDPEQAKKFVELTECDSLAVAIGTSHGAYKRTPGAGLRFDILREIHRLIPKTPLVLHGASQIPSKYAKAIGLKNTEGIDIAQIRKAARLGIRKINVDSDARLAWTATVKKLMAKNSANFDPRFYLNGAREELVALYVDTIRGITRAA